MDMFKEEPIKAVTVAIVVFAITSIARSSRLLEQSTDVL
jgi:hypothetical protein